MMMWMMLNEADVDEMPAHGQDDFSAWLQLVATSARPLLRALINFGTNA